MLADNSYLIDINKPLELERFGAYMLTYRWGKHTHKTLDKKKRKGPLRGTKNKLFPQI